MLPVAVARSSSDDNAITLCTSGFSDDVMFSHNGLYRTARGVDSIDVGAVLKQVVRTFSVFARGHHVFALVVVYNGSKWHTGGEV